MFVLVKMHKKCFILLHVLFLSGIVVFVETQRRGSCRTPNGESARCILVYECSLFLRAIRNQIPADLNFIKRSMCGHDGNAPLVCCGTLVEYTSIRTLPVESNNLMLAKNIPTKSSAVPDRSACGFQGSDNVRVEDFVYGGDVTKVKEFPWLALLGYTNPSGGILWLCGGTIISPKYILTAAHCTVGEAVKKVGLLSYVKLGEHDKNKQIDCDTSVNCNENPVNIRVNSVIPHENYNPDDKHHKNDIALIRLSKNIVYSDFIRPICLPEPNEASSIGDSLFTAGWGRNEQNTFSPVKLKVQLPLVNNEVCNKMNRIRLIESQICAGGQEGKDSCRGDSGGPLMRRSRTNYLQWYQEGIVSVGSIECGTKGYPGIYTKVSNFLPWIHSHVQD